MKITGENMWQAFSMRVNLGLKRSPLLSIGLATALCLIFCLSVAAQDELNSLSEEEQRQVKIAERFLTVLEKSPRRGTALERVYGHHVEFGSLDKFILDLQSRVKENPEDGTGWMLLGLLLVYYIFIIV